MRTVSVLFWLGQLLSARLLSAQLQITVQNAASGSADLVPGSLANLNLASTGQIPTAISARIQPGGGSAIPVSFVSQKAVPWYTFLVPKDLPPGTASLIVSNAGQDLATVSFNVVVSNPGIFTVSNSGGAYALAPPYSLTNSARPGDFVTLWGTGLGSVSAPSVLLGGHPVPVTYAGPAPGSPGLDQINFQVPQDAAIPDGCFVALTLQAGASTSNLVSISKSASGGICQTPFGFSADASQNPYFTIFSLSTSVDHPQSTAGPLPGFTRYEYASGILQSVNLEELISWTSPVLAGDAYFGCSASSRGGGVRWISASQGPGIPNFGAAFTLAGPSGSAQLTGPDFYQSSIDPPTPVTSIAALKPPFFTSGAWSLSNHSAGTDSPFQTNFTLPAPILAANVTESTVMDRSVDQAVTWNAATYTSTDVLTASLWVPLQWFTSLTVTCRVPAQEGSLTFPSSLLQQLPSGAGQLQLYLSRTPAAFAIKPNLPAVIQYSSSEMIPVQIK